MPFKKKHLRSICCCLAIAWIAATPIAQEPAATALDQRSTRKIDALITLVMAHQHVPAVSLAIAKNGQIFYASGYGYRDLTSRRAADANTIYNVGSVTKEFTAAGIMLLQQEGKLSARALNKNVRGFSNEKAPVKVTVTRYLYVFVVENFWRNARHAAFLRDMSGSI